jgi:hypothetical protein
VPQHFFNFFRPPHGHTGGLAPFAALSAGMSITCAVRLIKTDNQTGFPNGIGIYEEAREEVYLPKRE